MESGYVKSDPDTMTFEEVMEGLRHNYLKGTSEVVAEIDKKIFEKAYKFAKEKESYELTLIQGDVPNRGHVSYDPEAMAKAIDSYNKTHKESRLFLQPDGNIGMSISYQAKIAKDGTIIEDQ